MVIYGDPETDSLISSACKEHGEKREMIWSIPTNKQSIKKEQQKKIKHKTLIQKKTKVRKLTREVKQEHKKEIRT